SRCLFCHDSLLLDGASRRTRSIVAIPASSTTGRSCSRASAGGSCTDSPPASAITTTVCCSPWRLRVSRAATLPAPWAPYTTTSPTARFNTPPARGLRLPPAPLSSHGGHLPVLVDRHDEAALGPVLASQP